MPARGVVEDVVDPEVVGPLSGAASSRSRDVAVWLADVEHDRTSREALITSMDTAVQEYSAEEDVSVERGLAMFEVFMSCGGHEERLKRRETVVHCNLKLHEQSGLMFGRIELIIRGASCKDLVAYLMDYHGRHWRSRLDPASEIHDAICEVRNAHHITVRYECKAAPFRNRVFFNSLVWKKLSDEQFVWVSFPISDHRSHYSHVEEKNVVLGEGRRCIRLTQVGDNVTKLEYACSLDMKGRFPQSLTNGVVIPGLSFALHAANVLPSSATAR